MTQHRIRTFPRPHGPEGNVIECEHRGAAWLAERFGLSRGTVIRRSIHGTWPHAEPPTSGYPSPWFCAHDVQGIAGQVSHDG